MKLITQSLILAASTIVASTAHAQDAQALANAKACMACHNVQNKILGPSFKDVAAKYTDVDAVANSIKNGSTGKWGPVPMPANPVTEEEAKTLATWILSLK